MARAALGEHSRGLTPELKARLGEGQADIRQDFEVRAHAAGMLRGRARLVDRVVRAMWTGCAMPPGLALIAAGGYGRGELYPCSDVDLLVLLPQQPAGPIESKLEQFVGMAWDVGLDLGHAVRTVDQCLEEAERDITVQTNLLEARHLAGSRRLYAEFGAHLRAQLDPATFFNAKRLEQEARYARYEDTPYSLEPNCKESPGGLRDLQIILWVARASGLGRSWGDLARRGLITRGEALQLGRIENFVRCTRIRLHYIAGRREDRLVFDYQEALARSFGFAGTADKRASEALMQHYFRNAKAITQLNTILLQNLAALLSPGPPPAPVAINARFQTERELLDVTSEEVFEREPAAILESFRLLQEHPELRGMTARTLRALWRARRRINPGFRRDPLHRRLFLELLQATRGVVHEFRRMNQWGVLGRYLPAFARIVGQMQHDLFHVYTVDQHILQVLRNVRRFATAEHAHEYPLMSELITGFDRPWLIYLAALFHDIAKGRGGDHSALGAEEARAFCRQHGLSQEDEDLVAFLVRHHLTLSTVAQKQDLGDPEVIRAFAGTVRTERRLDALYLLTHADIRGTSPKVWNAWKAKLLEDLYHATKRLLQGATPHQALGLEERQEQARSRLRYHGLRPDVEQPLWDQLDTVYFLRHDAEEIAWHARVLYWRPASDEPVVKARVTHVDDSLQVMVYTRDQPELFARICGFFARLGYTIVDAKIHTTRHGYALDSFMVLDPSGLLAGRDMVSLIEHDLAELLLAQRHVDAPRGARLSRQVKHFPISPEVAIRPDASGQHYIMSVIATDRPGLLFSIAQVLARHGIDVHTAKIATLGERAEDTFLISGAELNQTATLVRIEQELLERLQL